MKVSIKLQPNIRRDAIKLKTFVLPSRNKIIFSLTFLMACRCSTQGSSLLVYLAFIFSSKVTSKRGTPAAQRLVSKEASDKCGANAVSFTDMLQLLVSLIAVATFRRNASMELLRNIACGKSIECVALITQDTPCRIIPALVHCRQFKPNLNQRKTT